MASQSANQPVYGATPESVKQSRLLAQALLKQGMETTPIHHWSQGLARVLQAGMGGYQQGQADKEERQARDQFSQRLLGDVKNKDLAAVLSDASSPWASDALVKTLGEAGQLRNLGEETTSETSPWGGQAKTSPRLGSTLNGGGGGHSMGVSQPPQAAPQQEPQTAPLAAVSRSALDAPPGGIGNIVGISEPQNIPPGVPASAAGIKQAVMVGSNPALPRPGPSQVLPEAQSVPTQSFHAPASQPPSQQSGGPKASPFIQKMQHFGMASDILKNDLAAGSAAQPRLERLKNIYNISEHLNDEGVIPKLRAQVAEKMGGYLGPHAEDYEVLDAYIKSHDADIYKEMVNGGRIPPEVAEQLRSGSAKGFQNKEVRRRIWNGEAAPLELAVRRGTNAMRPGGTGEDKASQNYNMKPDTEFLGRPPVDPAHAARLKASPHERDKFIDVYGPAAAENILGVQ